MKASEYAIIIIDGSKLPNADKLRCAVEIADMVVKEAAAMLEDHQSLHTQLLPWKEALAKWKDIVKHVLEDNPKHPIFLNIFGMVLAVKAPELYRTLVANHVFVNYRLNAKEQSVINEEKLQKILE